MGCRRIWAGCLALVTGVCCVDPGTVCAQDPWRPDREISSEGYGANAATTVRVGLFRSRYSASQEAAAQVPLDDLPAEVRDRVRKVVDKPTLFTRGPAERFTAFPGMYHWLLEHPNQGVVLWRRLGARCMDIQDRGRGVFGWSDGQGSDVRWWTVHRSPALRVWYAEGSVRAAGILPLVPVRAVVVLHHADEVNASGRTIIRHQADLFLYTDSKTAAVVARLMGPSAPRMAEQCASQIEMFFSALAWYLDQHPVKAETLLTGILPADAPEWHEVKERARKMPAGETIPPASVAHHGG